MMPAALIWPMRSVRLPLVAFRQSALTSCCSFDARGAHLGADVGWAHESYTRRDLIDVSTPGNEHSFGLGLRDHATDALVLAPVAGIEWQFTDHWTVSIMPRLQYVVGGVNRLGLLVPVSVGYSLYFF
jgi:hypothetical protein